MAVPRFRLSTEFRIRRGEHQKTGSRRCNCLFTPFRGSLEEHLLSINWLVHIFVCTNERLSCISFVIRWKSASANQIYLWYGIKSANQVRWLSDKEHHWLLTINIKYGWTMPVIIQKRRTVFCRHVYNSLFMARPVPWSCELFLC